MKSINEYVNEKDQSNKTIELEDKLKDILIEYANHNNYDATELIYMINLFIRDLYLDKDNSKKFKDVENALKTFNKEFEKYQNIMI